MAGYVARLIVIRPERETDDEGKSDGERLWSILFYWFLSLALSSNLLRLPSTLHSRWRLECPPQIS